MSCPYEKPYRPEEETCPVLGFQDVTVGVPVEIKPFAEVGKVKTECMGKPTVRRGTTNCEGRPGQVCKFTVSQKIRVEVPVVFGAKTKVGEASIDCKHHGFPQEPDAKPKGENIYGASEEEFRGIVG
ncbi:MAG: hypothetical protein Q4D57_06315 [Clostridia bacterium]|nr:hypothetical protein [Clostridia bacterium]